MTEIRLKSGIKFCNAVSAAGGNNADIERVLEKYPDFFWTAGSELVELSRQIQGDERCFHFMDDAVVFKIPALKRPSFRDVKASLGNIRSIERDDSAEGEVVVRLATVLKSTEEKIAGTDYERRLTVLRADGGLLGFQHWQWFLKNWNKPEAIPNEKVRATLKDLIGKVYIEFSGIVVADAFSYRFIPYADDDNQRWCGHWCWIDIAFCRRGRVAVAGK